MKVNFVNELSLEFVSLGVFSDEISSELNTFFNEKYLGADIESIIICVIIVNPKYDYFTKVRKPKYRKGKQSFVDHGVTIEVSNLLTFDIKLDFKESKKLKTKEQFGLVVHEKIIANFHIFKKLKINGFDVKNFYEELNVFFNRY